MIILGENVTESRKCQANSKVLPMHIVRTLTCILIPILGFASSIEGTILGFASSIEGTILGFVSSREGTILGFASPIEGTIQCNHLVNSIANVASMVQNRAFLIKCMSGCVKPHLGLAKIDDD